MEAPLRWTSSVFLVLALYIGNTWSQNVAPNCMLPSETLQGELLRDRNAGFVNPQQQMNDMFLYPPNRLAPGGSTAPILESQRQALQDRLCSQSPLNQQAGQFHERTNTVPISQSPSTNIRPVNAQSSVCAQPGPLFVNPEQIPLSQLKLPQEQCLNAPPTIQNLPLQNVGLPQLETLPPQGPLLPFGQELLPCPRSTLTGPPITSLTLSPNRRNCFRIESIYPNSLPYPNNYFTPLEPVVPEIITPSKDVLFSQEATPSLPQRPSPMYPHFTSLPLSSQETSNDVFSPGPAQCPTFNEPITKPHFSLQNQMPTQGSIGSQLNNLPQVPVFGPQSNILPETSACPATGVLPSTLQNSLPPSPLNMFRFPRPTIVQGMPFQSPLASPLPVPCDINTNIAIEGANPNPALIQQDPINVQIPTAPAAFMPNLLPGLSDQNVELYPLQSFPVSQPLLNSDSCSLTLDIPPVSFLHSPIIPRSCALPNPNDFGTVLPQVSNFVDYPITPLNLASPCLEALLPYINEPSIRDVSSFCESAIPDMALPIPINFQINIPPPIISPPSITIINAAPALDATNTEGLFDFPFPMPPIIIEGRRSRSRSWLPLVLVALFADDLGGYGGGCSCDSNPIPIPYPIPIPTNNPVIVNN